MKFVRSLRPSWGTRLFGLVFAASLAACNSSGSTVIVSGDDASTTDTPLYAINARVFSADFSNQVSYLMLVGQLDEGEATLDRAVEVNGSGSLWGGPVGGELYFVGGENLRISKYVVDDSGQLEKESNEIGLLSSGVSSIDTEALAFDGDRGFFFDLGSEQALEFDLNEMSLVDSHDLSDLRINSSSITYLGEGGFKRRGDEFVGVTFGSNALFDEVGEVSRLGFFDPSDGSLEVIDAPCGGLQYSFEADNGDWYFATDPWVAGVHALDNSRSPEPCLARLPAGSRQFDEETISLNETTQGITGGIIPGPNGTAFVRVLDQGVFPLTDETGYIDPFSAPAWRTWRIDLADPESSVELGREPIAGGIKFAVVDGVGYQNESAADFSTTTLVRTTSSGDLAEGLVVPGVAWNIVRVR